MESEFSLYIESNPKFVKLHLISTSQNFELAQLEINSKNNRKKNF